MKYQVNIFEVWCRSVIVEGANVEEARALANQLIESGVDAEGTFEYSHTMDTDQWPVNEVESDAPLTVVA